MIQSLDNCADTLTRLFSTLSRCRLFLVAILIPAMVQTGCISITASQADRLRKGMTRDQVLAIAAGKPHVVRDITISFEPRDRFTLMVFSYLGADRDQDDYWVVFRNDSTFHWGFPIEFNRSSDTLLNAIGVAAAEQP